MAKTSTPAPVRPQPKLPSDATEAFLRQFARIYKFPAGLPKRLGPFIPN